MDKKKVCAVKPFIIKKKTNCDICKKPLFNVNICDECMDVLQMQFNQPQVSIDNDVTSVPAQPNNSDIEQVESITISDNEENAETQEQEPGVIVIEDSEDENRGKGMQIL